MDIGGVHSWRMPVVWLVLVALWAGVVGVGVLLPSGDASAQGVAPVAAGSVGGVELSVGDAAHSVDVADYFTGTVSSYGAVSGDGGVASVAVSGSVVSVTAVAAGATSVSVTASNTSGSAVQVFAVKVLPAGCVVSLGALTAGSVTSSGGSWADGGCRSVNVAGSRSYLYYAGYVTFVVSEPVEVLFSLASTESKRLFLLEGSGTGGRVLGSASALSRTGSASASLWKSLSPGAYTLEATTYYAAREASFSLTVDSMALNPPDSCVTSKGTLAAGSTTTVSGSWARSEGCRSVNASANRQHRHYADYVSFTVTDTVEARFRLASAIGKHLILLEGAGTGGDVVGWPRTGYLTFPAVSAQKLAAGTYTIEAATFDTAVEGDYTLTIALAATKPTKGETLPDQEIPIGSDVAQIDVADAFSGTVDKYSVTSGDVAVVTASVDGSTVTLNGVAPGAATVTVTASNTAGSVSQSFTVTVNQIAAPQTVGALTAQTVTVGDTVTVDVTGAFTGTVDAYSAASDNTTVATVTTTGSQITLNGTAAGTATITVTATNAGGSVEQSFEVTVTQAAPTVAGTLAAQTMTAGDSVEVDVAGAFGGVVDSYTVTSDNARVVNVALSGSMVTFAGVAAGTATVTVAASNTGGSATQTIDVTVNLPPAPTLGAQLAAQSLQVTETLTVDVGAGFAGLIDSHTAVSGDARIVTVTVEGSEVTLTGFSVGSTTVTVTAINAAGRAARSFTVTVNALTAPQTANTPIARTIAVGEELPIHIADAFSGITGTYAAGSSDAKVLTATTDGSKVTLTGIAAGTATVTVEAVNDAGSASQTFTVTVKVPDKLAVAVSAPSHCLGSEGALALGGGRRGVGSIAVTYHITGGAGPYTITSPDAPDTTHTERTGAITIPCAQRGIDLTTVGPDVNVVESGPRTITLTVTDNTSVTTNTDIEIEVAEDAYTTEYNGGTMDPGKTYILGTRDQWVLITLPEGLTLQFQGLSGHNLAHFTEPITGTEIILDWTTGTEISRSIPTTEDGSSTAKSNTQIASRASADPYLEEQFTALTAAVLVPGETFTRNSVNGTDWRPYRGLPDNTSVAIHPKLFHGLALEVCIDVTETRTEFKKATDSHTAVTSLATTIANAVDLWNSKTGQRSIGARLVQGLAHNVFDFDSANPGCGGSNSGEVQFIIRTNDIECGGTQGAAGCAHWVVKGNPPQVTGKIVEIDKDHVDSQYVVSHELGHFLGLGDYGHACPLKSISQPGRITAIRVTSLMAYGSSGCKSDTVEDRDLEDLSKIYHPLRRSGVEIRAHSGLGPPTYYVYTGKLSHDFNGNYVELAHKYAFFEREITSGSPWKFVRWYDLDAVNGSNNQGAEIHISYDPWSLVYELTDNPRSEYMIVGVSKGDHKRIEGLSQGRKYSVLQKDNESWSLGTPTIAADPARPGSGSVVSGAGTGAGSSGGQSGPAPAIASVPFCPIGDGFVWNLRELGDGGAKCDRVQSANVVSTAVWRCSRSQGVPRIGLGGVVGCVREESGMLRSRLGSPECELGFTPVNGGASCSRTVSVLATATTDYLCPSGYTLVTVQTPFCHRSIPAKASTQHKCPVGYSLVSIPLGAKFCRRSVPASATATRECRSEYVLVRFFVSPGVAGYRCEKSVAATVSRSYVCTSGYRLVRIPLGGQYCQRTISAAATYSCQSGYTRSGSSCYRYVFKNLTGRTCPTGYSVFFNGLYHLCRKKVTVSATVTYSCTSGKLSGSKCVFTKSATTKSTYSCRSGTLTGTKCVFTTSPTVKTTYSCTSGTLSGSSCVFTTSPTVKTIYSCSSGRLSGSQCVFTTTPTSKITYDCDDASSGYTLSGRNCVKTITKPSTRPTLYYCDSGYTRDIESNTCGRTITTTPTKISVYGCPTVPSGEPSYELLITTTTTGITRTCTRTITIAAETEPTCPEASEGEDPYTLSVTTNSEGQTTHNCTQSTTTQDDEDAG